MAYSDDAVLAKFSALNETHDSIATAAQWIMFHRRHADRTVQIWLQRLKDSPSPKRLNLLYLANEVAQQSKTRGKDEFLHSFAPIIAEATATAYKGAPSELQTKLRRVVDVWRDRAVFEQPIQAAIDARIEELDKVRGASKASFGTPIFGATSSVPPGLSHVVSLQTKVTKLEPGVKSALEGTEGDYERLSAIVEGRAERPAAPVLAARLNGLLKTLASTEGVVAESVKVRGNLVEELQNLLNKQDALLQQDRLSLQQLVERREYIDKEKNSVESDIMRGLSVDRPEGAAAAATSVMPTIVKSDAAADGGNGIIGGTDADVEGERPTMEALTPPRPTFEALTPPPPEIEALTPPPGIIEALTPPPPAGQLSAFRPPPISSTAPGSSGANPAYYQIGPVIGGGAGSSGSGSNKRRRLDHDDSFPDLSEDGDDGIDADVAEMLRSG